MEIKLLRAFSVLAGLGHYGRAADQLCMTQSTLTKQIQTLEATLGVALFERGRHGAVLTPQGRLFRKDAQALLDQHAALLARMGQVSAGTVGQLALGFGLSTLERAPALIAVFRQQVPDCRITLDDVPSVEQHRRLLAGSLDAGFCRAPVAGSGLAFLPLMEERLALAWPMHLVLPAQREALNTLGFIALSPARGPGLTAQIAQWSRAAGFTPRVTQYADDLLTVHAVVAAGLGAALLPWHGASALAQRTQLQPLPEAAACWPVGLCWREGDSHPLLQRFVAFVRDQR
ncbi:LysR family transcriptional regulator [Chitinolyticbacter meiyuanensis]|uniref:LysR family transcriptional regulator n=1 Tax=Chitinolyticbacter meiyuanensis TaxID=682798 RepID=UPI0011E5B20F|nr:LysR family transcriptional regulator [Chitinolyticbacter meiyuanensis]